MTEGALFCLWCLGTCGAFSILRLAFTLYFDGGEVGRGGLLNRLFLDFLNQGYHLLGVSHERDASREPYITRMNLVPHLGEAGDIDDELVGQAQRVGLDRKLVEHPHQVGTRLHCGRLADELERDRDLHLLPLRDRVEINVTRGVRDRVEVALVDQRREGRAAKPLERDDGRLPREGEDFVEGARLNRDGSSRLVRAVDHCRELARAPERAGLWPLRLAPRHGK